MVYANSWSYLGIAFSAYIACFVVGVFMWWLDLLTYLVFSAPLILFVFIEVVYNKDCSNFYNCEARPTSFWVFLITEFIVFGTLFVVFLWFYEAEPPISSPSGYSMAGSVCLVCSSVWASLWHREVWLDLRGLAPYSSIQRDVRDVRPLFLNDSSGVISGPHLSSYKWFGWTGSTYLFYPEEQTFFSRNGVHFFYLLVTIFLGIFFIKLQLMEFAACSTNITSSAAYASFYSIVGLHFLHVCLGVTGLCLYPVLFGSSGVYYYSSILAWYWHFVDYVWLWVYLLLYYL